MLTGDDKALIVVQRFSEESRCNQLWVDEETDLLLHQALSCHPSPNKSVGEVDL